MLPCEPQLGKRGLYPTISSKGSAENVRAMMNLLSYCDGKHSLLEISKKINIPFWQLTDEVKRLVDSDVIKKEPIIFSPGETV